MLYEKNRQYKRPRKTQRHKDAVHMNKRESIICVGGVRLHAACPEFGLPEELLLSEELSSLLSDDTDTCLGPGVVVDVLSSSFSSTSMTGNTWTTPSSSAAAAADVRAGSTSPGLASSFKFNSSKSSSYSSCRAICWNWFGFVKDTFSLRHCLS